jgi:hypothetical protein
MSSLNIGAVALATIAQFVVGAIWYMPLFGKLWGDIHGFNKLSRAEQKVAQAKMMPLLGVQLLVTILISVVLAKLVVVLPNYSAYALAVMAWIGFVVPTQVSAVVFGGTEPQWIVKKTAIMAGGSLACLLVAAAILGAMR